eukprot:TRINITY_DN12417_c0_g1_i1.p1 TRINITY_DN12417_c0_g1~~TRINITY_DN12417_c0_g1_i1.p1  ORF type:complete len:399 (+),score=88.63 TRINITY_DN12417_c0_g1_i1:62-1258(+)
MDGPEGAAQSADEIPTSKVEETEEGSISASEEATIPVLAPKLPKAKRVMANVKPFVGNLFRMLDDPTCHAALRWTESGTGLLLCSQILLSQLLPKYFGHNSYRSLTKMLNANGFQKIPASRREQHMEGSEYRHQYFVRGRPDWLPLVVHPKTLSVEDQEELAAIAAASTPTGTKLADIRSLSASQLRKTRELKYAQQVATRMAMQQEQLRQQQLAFASIPVAYPPFGATPLPPSGFSMYPSDNPAMFAQPLMLVPSGQFYQPQQMVMMAPYAGAGYIMAPPPGSAAMQQQQFAAQPPPSHVMYHPESAEAHYLMQQQQQQQQQMHSMQPYYDYPLPPHPEVLGDYAFFDGPLVQNPVLHSNPQSQIKQQQPLPNDYATATPDDVKPTPPKLVGRHGNR